MNLGIGAVAVLAPMYQACGPRQLRARAIKVCGLSIPTYGANFCGTDQNFGRAKALRPKQQPRIRRGSPVSR